MDWTALWLTLRLALCTTAILLVLGLPLAHWLANSRWRFKFLVESVVAMPLILPPTVLGFYLLVALGPHSPVGRFWEGLTGSPLPFTFAGILVGSIVCNLPFAVQPFAASFASVDRRLVEASWCLGQSRLRTFLRVTVPLSRAGILTGLVLSFAHTVGEFGVVLMIGGNIPGVTRTLSLAIYDDVQALDYRAAAQTSLVLLAFAFVTLCLTYAWRKKAATA
ncbi:MAG: molybdate ABC transporter permease subunit [Planctomycetota bacterium]|nr:molybdate ABC transporter permease subunit [Planctomycetota bacterium]